MAQTNSRTPSFPQIVKLHSHHPSLAFSLTQSPQAFEHASNTRITIHLPDLAWVKIWKDSGHQLCSNTSNKSGKFQERFNHTSSYLATNFSNAVTKLMCEFLHLALAWGWAKHLGKEASKSVLHFVWQNSLYPLNVSFHTSKWSETHLVLTYLALVSTYYILLSLWLLISAQSTWRKLSHTKVFRLTKKTILTFALWQVAVTEVTVYSSCLEHLWGLFP